MRRPLICIFLFCITICAVAQRDLKKDKFSSTTITLPVGSNDVARKFSQIMVMDKRFDTSKAGFATDGAKHTILQVNGGLANSLQQYLEKNYTDKNSSLPQLLFVLRNLWLQQLKAGERNEGEEVYEKQNISQCIAKMEVYVLKEDVCQALVRIDTTLEGEKLLKQAGGDMLKELLDYSMQKISAMQIEEAIAKKSKIKLPDLIALYNKRTILPQTTNESLKRGIYTTFTDFVQNTPKPYDFVLEQDEGGDYLYLNEGSNQRLFTDFWGFCDGRFHFIRLGSNFFPLVRDNNSFSFLGCLQPVHNTAPRSRNRVARYALFGVLGELHRNRLIKFLRPMQLDMETGKPF